MRSLYFIEQAELFWKLSYLHKLHKYELPKTLICPISLAVTVCPSFKFKPSTWCSSAEHRWLLSLQNMGIPCQGKKSRSKRRKFNPGCYICKTRLQSIPPQGSEQKAFPHWPMSPAERWWLAAAAPCSAASGQQNPTAPGKASLWDLPQPVPPSNNSTHWVGSARNSWQRDRAAR